MVAELPRVLSTVLKASTTSQVARDALEKEGVVPGKITAALIRPRLNKAYVDDAKLTDHHAIIPTYNYASSELAGSPAEHLFPRSTALLEHIHATGSSRRDDSYSDNR